MNPLYQVNPSNPTSVTLPDYTAFAIEEVIQREWVTQVTLATAILACIKDRDLNWRKGYQVNGTGAIVPLITDDLSAAQQSGTGGFLASNAGVSDANEIPSGWPTYDITEGFTFAYYDFTHLRRALTLKDSEKRLGTGRGRATSILDAKTKQLISKFKTIMADMIEGNSNAASRTSLMGLPYLLSTSNSPGGISQSTYSYWQAQVNSNVGTLSLPMINNAYDTILRNADLAGDTQPPDLLMLAFNGTGVNCFGRMRELIAPAERIVNAKFQATYGFANFEYLGLKCVMGNRMPTGTANLLTTDTFFYGGMETPAQLGEVRILGSDAYEYMYTLWNFLGCKECRRNAVLKGITG